MHEENQKSKKGEEISLEQDLKKIILRKQHERKALLKLLNYIESNDQVLETDFKIDKEKK